MTKANCIEFMFGIKGVDNLRIKVQGDDIEDAVCSLPAIRFNFLRKDGKQPEIFDFPKWIYLISMTKYKRTELFDCEGEYHDDRRQVEVELDNGFSVYVSEMSRHLIGSYDEIDRYIDLMLKAIGKLPKIQNSS